MSDWIGFSIVVWALGVVLIAILAVLAQVIHGLMTGPYETVISILVVLAVIIVPIAVGIAFIEVAGRVMDYAD